MARQKERGLGALQGRGHGTSVKGLQGFGGGDSMGPLGTECFTQVWQSDCLALGSTDSPNIFLYTPQFPHL